MFTFEKLIYRERVNQRSDGQTETEKKAREEPTTTNDFNVLQMLLLVVSCLLHFIEFTTLLYCFVPYRTVLLNPARSLPASRQDPKKIILYCSCSLHCTLCWMWANGSTKLTFDWRKTEQTVKKKGDLFLMLCFVLRCSLYDVTYGKMITQEIRIRF